MKIGILLAHESTPFAGVVRPFINWAHGLKMKDYDIEFLMVNDGRDIAEYLLELGFQVYNFDNTRTLSHFCREKGYGFIFTDDYIERLKIIDNTRGNFKKAIYCQVLYGIHAICAIPKSPSVKERLVFSIAKLVPFSLLRERYTKFLKKADIVIANSQTTANLLHMLYGIESDGVVYPPINTDIFKPQKIQRRNKVVLYLGSHAGDTDGDLLKEVCGVLKDKFDVLVLGNRIFAERFKKKFNVTHISGVSDEKLATIYSKCRITICPQKWEQFGLVPVESMACGTPVLAFNRMGFQETIISGKTGWLANRKKEFLDKLNDAVENGVDGFSKRNLREHVVKNFSIAASIGKLEKLLRDNHET